MTTKKEIVKMTEEWSEKMEVPILTIRFKDLKSIYGQASRNLKDGRTVTYSLDLLKESDDWVEYVVIHELAHHKVGLLNGHNWQLHHCIAKYCPDWNNRIANLKIQKCFL